MNDTTNVRNWVFLTLQKRPLCDATQPLSISNVAKEAIFETFETQHLCDELMSAPRPQSDFGDGDPGSRDQPFVKLDFPVSPSPTGHFGKEQSGTDFVKRGALDGSRRDRPGDCPAMGSFERTSYQRLLGRGSFQVNALSLTTTFRRWPVKCTVVRLP